MNVTSTAELFAPVKTELATVEKRLRQTVQDQHSALAEATQHLLNAGGKRLRPAVVLLTAGMFDADRDQAVSLATAVEMLHTATLVHDDLIDGALLRRGAPTLNADCSLSATVLTGDYLFARAAHFIAQTRNARIVELFAETLMVIVDGEIKQNFSKGNIDRADYYARIYAKTAALFAHATEAAAILGDADEVSLAGVREFGHQIGMAFQIVDDVLDFVGTPDQTGKPIGGDLRQGSFTLPAIYHLQAHPDNPHLNALFNGRVKRGDVVSRAVAAVRASGATDEALREAREFVERGQLALEKLPDTPHTQALSAIARYIVNRSS